jgi:hypothetical protein
MARENPTDAKTTITQTQQRECYYNREKRSLRCQQGHKEAKTNNLVTIRRNHICSIRRRIDQHYCEASISRLALALFINLVNVRNYHVRFRDGKNWSNRDRDRSAHSQGYAASKTRVTCGASCVEGPQIVILFPDVSHLSYSSYSLQQGLLKQDACLVQRCAFQIPLEASLRYCCKFGFRGR